MFSQDGFKRKESKDVMYRSNSSLELVHTEQPVAGVLRREYGSHGSIDVIGGSAGMPHNKARGELAADHADGPTPRLGASPKLRNKFQKLWGGNGHNIPKVPLDDVVLRETFTQLSVEVEHAKRRNFAHYDCQSLMANLGYAAELRGALLSRRRNTTTGASAASLLAARGSMPDNDALPDTGDGRSNDLLECCPFFRNELGGEEERCVSLCRRTAGGGARARPGGWHRPRAACGLALLEQPAGQSHWRHGCPFAPQHAPPPLDTQDLGALYYRNYFYNQPRRVCGVDEGGRATNGVGGAEATSDRLNVYVRCYGVNLKRAHQNWFGMDENLGPVGISIKKERVELRRGGVDSSAPATQLVWQYRLVIRTSELLTLRGAILEDSLPTAKPSNNTATYNTKEVLEYVAPEVQSNCLRLGVTNNGAEEQLLRLDEQCITRHYKVGVMYCKSGQATEEEMYNNQEAGPAFVEFLQTLGQTVRLKGFDKYKAGLDNKSDSTGLYSVYTTYQSCEIMFHVSTMLPYTPNNRQQLLRKRHIGNDIVTIVFQEPGAAPFTPRNIRSQFQHVFVVVRAIDPCTENTHYSIAVSRAKEVPLFGPPIKEGAVYPKGEAFTDLLLSKVINGENAAIQSPKFSTMATRTRQEYLKDLAKNYVTATTLDTGQKFSLFSSLLMKGGNSSAMPPPRADIADVLVGGALCYHVQVQDEGAGGALTDCFMGVSPDTIVFVEEATRQIVLVIPTEMLLGWVVSGGWTRLYYHRGECVHVRGGGDPLLRRLAHVAPPHAARLQEIALERAAAPQLGFHVQPDGLVTAVETGGPAARAGLRRGARLLEVCRAAVASLHHDQLVDLLKTSDPVTVTVTFATGSRCECGAGGEECAWPARGDAQQPGRPRRAYDRGLSPPHSDSSGYGTGGSGRSGRRSPQSSPVNHAEVVRWRRSHDDSPRRASVPAPKRSTPSTSSLQVMEEELMRIMDAELGGQVASARPAAVRAPGPAHAPPLPLPDATALDWPALVHTATRAMLQICEEHQYPSMDGADLDTPTADAAPDPWQDTPSNESTTSAALTGPGPGAGAGAAASTCECGLTSRVAALEADAATAARQRHQLEEEVRRLRRHNARLREESARAVRQLRRFTQWFMHTVERQ